MAGGKVNKRRIHIDDKSVTNIRAIASEYFYIMLIMQLIIGIFQEFPDAAIIIVFLLTNVLTLCFFSPIFHCRLGSFTLD